MSSILPAKSEGESPLAPDFLGEVFDYQHFSQYLPFIHKGVLTFPHETDASAKLLVSLTFANAIRQF